MNHITHSGDGSVNLQVTLSASSANHDPRGPVAPHHPITCGSELRYEEDGSFACEHASVPPTDLRTRFCIDHSVALLLIELSRQL